MTRIFVNLLFCVSCLLLLRRVNGLPEIIKIGVLFDEWDAIEETAFRHAIERVNSDPNLLTRSRLTSSIEKLPNADSFHASKKVCEMLSGGLAGIFGPQNPQTSSHVQSVAEVLEIPHFETKWDFRPNGRNFLTNLSPRPSSLSRAYADLIEAWGWKKFVVIYENNESLVRLQEILKSAIPGKVEATVKQLSPDDDFRPLFKEIRVQTDIVNIIIDCQIEKIPKIFEHARQVGMMSQYYKYFITSLDIHTVNLDEFMNGDINVTAFRMIDPFKPSVSNIIQAWESLVLFGFQNRTNNPYQSIYIDESIYAARNAWARNQQAGFPSISGGGRTLGNGQQIPSLPNNMLKTEVGLIYDAIELFSRALHGLDASQTLRIDDFKPLSCSNPQDTFQFGYILMEALNKVQFEGVTGVINFDSEGLRSDFQLDVMELTQKGISKIGVWDSKLRDKFVWTRTVEETLKQQEEDLRNKTLIVTTKLSNPYCMISANGTYEGYAIDLLQLIAESFQFQYEIKLVKDNRYGNPNNKTKYGWDGIIEEILEGEADLGIADLTINYEREKTVDFTMPFMNLGISILYKKPTKNPPSLFSFLEPFHFDVWIYMATAFLAVSLILFILARIVPDEWQEPAPCSPDSGKILENPFNMVNSLWFCMGSLLAQGCDFLPKLSPDDWLNPNPTKKEEPEELELELHLPNTIWVMAGATMQQQFFEYGPRISPDQWTNPHPCRENPEELENELSLSNCLWHNWGSLMQQGSDIAPKAGSTRTVAGIWWFFTLIMISSYTANLAAFLTKEGLESGISDIKDLPGQTKVKYGCLGSGSTASFFRDSSFPLYKDIWSNMLNMKPTPFVDSTREGMERVDKSDGEYAFFMESSSIEYVTERNCKLTQIGGLLDSKGYGIALRKYSKYRDAFSSKVLELQERGELEKLKVKWWKEQGGGLCSVEVTAGGGAQALTLAHVGGVFVVLLGGCGVACIMAFFEFLWKSRKLARNEGESLLDEMWKELKFALQCKGNRKPVVKRKTPTESKQSLGTGSIPYLGLNNNGDLTHRRTTNGSSGPGPENGEKEKNGQDSES